MLIMETNKMFTVNGEEDALLRHSKREYFFVRERDTCASAFVDGRDIVTQLSEFHNYREWEILIRIQLYAVACAAGVSCVVRTSRSAHQPPRALAMPLKIGPSSCAKRSCCIRMLGRRYDSRFLHRARPHRQATHIGQCSASSSHSPYFKKFVHRQHKLVGMRPDQRVVSTIDNGELGTSNPSVKHLRMMDWYSFVV